MNVTASIVPLPPVRIKKTTENVENLVYFQADNAFGSSSKPFANQIDIFISVLKITNFLILIPSFETIHSSKTFVVGNTK